MFSGIMILLLVVAVLVLMVVIFIFCRKRNQGEIVLKEQEKRYFTEEDRKAVMLIQELDKIISDVKKAVK